MSKLDNGDMSVLPCYEDFAPPNYPFKELEIVSISLSHTDRLRMIGGTPELIQSLRIAIQQSYGWSNFQQEYEYTHKTSTHEFKLLGNPWLGCGEDAIRSRKLILSVFKCMAQCGWNLLYGIDISKLEYDADTLFFEKGEVDPAPEIFAMSLNMTDRIRLIDAPEKFGKLLVQEIIIPGWEIGIQQVRNYCGSFEIKLAGNPWQTSDPFESINANLLIAKAISKFHGKGYKLYGSVDISLGSSDQRDLDTSFFRRMNLSWPSTD